MSGKDERPIVSLKCVCGSNIPNGAYWLLKRSGNDIADNTLLGWYLFDTFISQNNHYTQHVLLERRMTIPTVELFIEEIKIIECGCCLRKLSLGGTFFNDILSETKRSLYRDGYQLNNPPYSVERVEENDRIRG